MATRWLFKTEPSVYSFSRLLKDGKSEMFKTAKVDFIDDGPGKPVGIYRNIGRRPIIAPQSPM